MTDEMLAPAHTPPRHPRSAPPTRTSLQSYLVQWLLLITWLFPAAGGLKYQLAKCATKKPSRPPLVVIPGFAQSIDLYLPHLPALSKDNDVIVCQALGSGASPPSHRNVSLPAQVAAMERILDEEFGRGVSVNVAGFSMGGRVALAAGCLWQDRIHKLHVTGVGLRPSPHAELHYLAWRELLQQDNLHGFAWSVLLASYHPSFLLQNNHRISAWVHGLAQAHTARGLQALLEQTHLPEWNVESMAPKLSQRCQIRLLVGEADRMASVGSVKELAEVLTSVSQVSWSSIPSCGHALPMEAPRAWRDDLLHFLNS